MILKTQRIILLAKTMNLFSKYDDILNKIFIFLSLLLINIYFYLKILYIQNG